MGSRETIREGGGWKPGRFLEFKQEIRSMLRDNDILEGRQDLLHSRGKNHLSKRFPKFVAHKLNHRLTLKHKGRNLWASGGMVLLRTKRRKEKTTEKNCTKGNRKGEHFKQRKLHCLLPTNKTLVYWGSEGREAAQGF